MYDINQVRADFPILSRTVYDKPLVYLDNAATTQKPLCVLDAMRDEYLNVNANVHRGVHYLSQQATDLHEAAPHHRFGRRRRRVNEALRRRILRTDISHSHAVDSCAFRNHPQDHRSILLAFARHTFH